MQKQKKTKCFGGMLLSRRIQISTCVQFRDTFIQFIFTEKLQIMKKRSEETQTLRASCSKAEPKIFAPPQTPFPGARDGQNLIRDGHYLYLQIQFGEDRCTQFRVIVVTDPPTNRQGRLQYTAPQLACMQCNKAQ